METERFEALIDAILAIIITIIVMEIPLPETTSLSSLFDLSPQFLSYALSFVICFNVWNYHHNLFSIVNKLNSSITWTGSIAIMIVGLLPHVTTMISTDFYSFTAQAMFGLVFLLTNINFYVADLLLIRFDKANIALRLALKDRKKITIIGFLLQVVGFIIGYLFYPPAIFVGCVLSVAVSLSWPKIKEYL
ncbi:MAG: DUF1211 domain-containing protein [Methanosphaera sp.]|nr:DUF1211 domain-containing protein [Methanosphaera sp.]